MNDPIAKAAELIAEAALKNEDAFDGPAANLVRGLRDYGLKQADTLGFLLTIAVDGQLAQPDAHDHCDEIVDSIDGLARCLQVAADAIREAMDDENENEITPELVTELSGKPCTTVFHVEKPDNVSDGAWETILQIMSEKFPTVAFVEKA